MMKWIRRLRVDPLPSLVSSRDEALRYFVKRDLLDEAVNAVESLWELPDVLRIVRRQRTDGAWPRKGRTKYSYPTINSDLAETAKNLSRLVEKYGFNKHHPTIRKAADYLFTCQTEEGDFRGIYGTQYMPWYHALITELLIKAGYVDDPRLEEGFQWLISIIHDDGGWCGPIQAVTGASGNREIWSEPPIPFDKKSPSSHFATGMVLRAFAVHPEYRKSGEARAAGELLKSRFFKPDIYTARKALHYWTKFQYPFWWPNILTALDSLSLIGFSKDNEDIQKGLSWFVANQEKDGLWKTSYENEKAKERYTRLKQKDRYMKLMVRERDIQLWVGLAVCRVFKRFYG